MESSEFFNRVVSLLIFFVSLPLVLWRWGKNYIHKTRLGAKFPGPFAVPIIGNAFDVLFLSSAGIYRHAIKTTRKYAPLFRYYIGPILVISSYYSGDSEHVLSGYKYVDKSYFYDKFLNPWLGTGLLISSGAKWRWRRKVLTPAFHFKILDQFQPVFLSCGDEFVRQLRKRAGGAAFDVFPLVKLFTLDVICETAMGIKMNAQSNSDSEYVRAVEEVTLITANRLLSPWLHPDFIFKWSPIGRRYKKCLEVLHGTTDRVIRERREEILKISESVENTTFDADELGRRRRVAFLDLLLLEARGGKLSDADIREEVDTFMFEGHDTTASAVSFSMYLLSRHQDVQEKILDELKSVFDWSQPLQPSMKDLSELNYLEMVIKESLRLYPPVNVIFRDVKEDDALPSTGHVMPAGSVVQVDIRGVHLQENAYPDAEKFDPERFSAEESVRRHPFAYLPFSAGPRNCIGQRFAMQELKSVLAKVVWHFRILADPSFEPQLEWKLIIQSENGLRMRLENRR